MRMRSCIIARSLLRAHKTLRIYISKAAVGFGVLQVSRGVCGD